MTKRKSELQRLTEAVRAAERELDAAPGRIAVNAAAKKLMRARAELKRCQEEATASGLPSWLSLDRRRIGVTLDWLKENA